MNKKLSSYKLVLLNIFIRLFLDPSFHLIQEKAILFFLNFIYKSLIVNKMCFIIPFNHKRIGLLVNSNIMIIR